MIKTLSPPGENPSIAVVLSDAKPTGPKHRQSIVSRSGNHQSYYKMIPIGNIGLHPLSVGIATLNRRLNINDALRATLPKMRLPDC